MKETIKKMAIGLPVFVLSFLVGGFTLMMVWKNTIVPAFDVAEATLAQCVVAWFFLRYTTQHVSGKNDKEEITIEFFKNQIARMISYAVFFIGLSYAINLFIS